MYKKQMKFQNIICYLALACGAIFFLYSLGIMTDLYDCLYSTMPNPSDLTETTVSGSIVYYNMQGFNRLFLVFSIVYILLGVFLFFTQTNKRRRYYVGNYVAISLFVIFTLFFVIWSHIQIESFKAQWLNIDFDALLKHSKMFKTAFTESTFWFDIHYFISLFALISASLLAFNCYWKRALMKEERRLIEEGEKK